MYEPKSTTLDVFLGKEGGREREALVARGEKNALGPAEAERGCKQIRGAHSNLANLRLLVCELKR